MKMKHRETGEIVFVIGYVARHKGTFARCLCDARLHPGRKVRSCGEGTVEMEIAIQNLVAVDIPNWAEIETQYPPNCFEKIRSGRMEEHINAVKASANSQYEKELAKLKGEGMPDDVAERLASEKKEAYIKSRLEPKTEDGGSEQRPVRW